MIYGNVDGARPLPPWSKRARRNVRWLEAHARVPDGPKAGQALVLTQHQRNKLRCIYQHEDRLPRCVIISEARKNAKTALAAYIVLLHTVGPEARPYLQTVTTARVKDQAAQTYGYCSASIRMSPTLAPVVDLKDAAKEFTVTEIRTTYKALSKEAKTKLGSSPGLAIHDEVGQVEGPVDALIDNIETGMKAHTEPMSVFISTQAPNDGDYLSLLIDDALARPEAEDLVLFFSTASKEREEGIPEQGKAPEEWAVPPDPEYPYSEAAIRAANPEAGILCNMRELLADAAKAKRLPSFDPTYRNLTLNQRVRQEALFVPRGLWNVRARPGLSLPDKKVPIYLGLDLSQVGDLTALGAVWEDPVERVVVEVPTDKGPVSREVPVLNMWARAWLPAHEIGERSRRDKVPYDVWAKQGHLQLIQGRAISYPFVAGQVKDIWDTQTVALAGFDRWGWPHFRDSLREAGMASHLLEDMAEYGSKAKWRPIGMGSASITPIMREMETRFLQGTFNQPNNPVLNMCAANVAQRGPDNARTMVKKHDRARIDAFMAVAIAVGAWLQSPRVTSTPGVRFL